MSIFKNPRIEVCGNCLREAILSSVQDCVYCTFVVNECVTKHRYYWKCKQCGKINVLEFYSN